jgi:hypothetical protein
MANSRSVLIAARSMRSGSGRGGVRRYSSGMPTVCQMMVAQWLARCLPRSAAVQDFRRVPEAPSIRSGSL